MNSSFSNLIFERKKDGNSADGSLPISNLILQKKQENNRKNHRMRIENNYYIVEFANYTKRLDAIIWIIR